MHMLAQQTATGPLSIVAPFLFYAFATLVCLGAWGIVLSQNIVRMAVYLLMTLGGVAAFYFMLSAEFLAAIQLIVYAGGTLILITFGVMLTSKNPFMKLRARPWEIGVGLAVGVMIAVLLVVAVIGTELSGQSELDMAGENEVALIGEALLSGYVVPFEISAVLLLVVMIAAAYMAKRRTR